MRQSLNKTQDFNEDDFKWNFGQEDSRDKRISGWVKNNIVKLIAIIFLAAIIFLSILFYSYGR